MRVNSRNFLELGMSLVSYTGCPQYDSHDRWCLLLHSFPEGE